MDFSEWTQIYNKKFISEFAKYINLCDEIKDTRVDEYVEQLKQYTGGDTKIRKTHFSQLIAFLKRGIVIHHGSLPLQTRLIIERFTKDGLCNICFATSTLEQGINMPFDVVYLDRLEGSKPLAVKNLIGRAGRSTMDSKFDYGYVIVSSANRMAKFRNIMGAEEVLDDVSSLEKDDIHDVDYNEFKEAILNDTYSDEYNLTEKDLEKLTSKDVKAVIFDIIKTTFNN